MPVDQPSIDIPNSAIATLTHNGFAITGRDSTSVALAGPGLNSTKQNPPQGASEITLRLSGNQLAAEAEMKGIDQM